MLTTEPERPPASHVGNASNACAPGTAAGRSASPDVGKALRPLPGAPAGDLPTAGHTRPRLPRPGRSVGSAGARTVTAGAPGPHAAASPLRPRLLQGAHLKPGPAWAPQGPGQLSGGGRPRPRGAAHLGSVWTDPQAAPSPSVLRLCCETGRCPISAEEHGDTSLLPGTRPGQAGHSDTRPARAGARGPAATPRGDTSERGMHGLPGPHGPSCPAPHCHAASTVVGRPLQRGRRRLLRSYVTCARTHSRGGRDEAGPTPDPSHRPKRDPEKWLGGDPLKNTTPISRPREVSVQGGCARTRRTERLPARGSGNTGWTAGQSGASRGGRGCAGAGRGLGRGVRAGHSGVDDGTRAQGRMDARVTPQAAATPLAPPWPGVSREYPDPTRGPCPLRPPQQGRGEASAVTTAAATARRCGPHESHAASRDAPGRPAVPNAVCPHAELHAERSAGTPRPATHGQGGPGCLGM